MANLSWSQANPFSISFDNTLETWNAGHINDILAIGDSIIVASETGGVWLINPEFGAVPKTNGYPATCLSDDWLGVNMSSLAFGPDDQMQVYAACSSPPALYALTFQARLGGGLDFVGATKIYVPTNWGLTGISKVVVQQNPRRIVITTGAGILWSPIPTPFDQVVGYDWGLASGLPDGGYSGLAHGPGSTLVAAASGANVATGLYGLFIGNWTQQAASLQFARATIVGSDPKQMRRTSVASCAGNRKVLYAVAAGANDSIFNVLKSQDGGNTWAPVSIPPAPGVQGFYNNCIDVHPSNPATVAIGWQRGPFVSINNGAVWTTLAGSGIHADFHAVYFPSLAGDPDALFVGSDGGVALISANGSVNSKYNMHLLNLQFIGGCGSASSRYPGLFTCGTQDNGNLACVVDPNAAPIHQPWTQVEGGDGGVNRLLSTGQLLRDNNGDARVRSDTWDPNALTFPGGGGTVILIDGKAEGLPSPVLEIVNSPQYSRNNQKMYAIGGGTDVPSGTAQNIYGLFADQGGANMHWIFIATAGENIISLASASGNKIIIGTDQGHILACDSPTGRVTAMPLSPAVTALRGSITALRVFDDSLMYAIHSAGWVLRYNAAVWDILPGLPWQQYTTMEADWTANPNVLYVATSTAVFSTDNNGQSWTNDSQGLPAVPQCCDLRLAVPAGGSRFLYLATYGRSLWRAPIVPHGTPIKHRFPNYLAQFARVLFGVLGDGGGATTGGPVPPWGPEQDLFAGLLAAALAQTLPGNLAKANRAEALQLVALRAHELAQGEGAAKRELSPAKEGVPGPAAKAADFARILEIVAHFQQKAHPEHELVAGLLAAALARQHPGAEGKKALGEALGFIARRAQELIGI